MKIVKNDEQVSPKYNPMSKYTWTPQDVFELSGEQFGMVLNAFRAVLSTPEAQRILLIEKANEAIESAMVTAVEKGIVVEVNEP